jgi:hypothetical protein
MDPVFPPSQEMIAAILEKKNESLSVFDHATDAASFEAAEELNKEYIVLKESCDSQKLLFELVRKCCKDAAAALQMELGAKQPSFIKAGEWKMLLKRLDSRMQPYIDSEKAAAKEAAMEAASASHKRKAEYKPEEVPPPPPLPMDFLFVYLLIERCCG